MSPRRHKTITRRDLAEAALPQIGTMAESRRFVDALFEEMESEMARAGALKIYGFGVFRLREKRARAGRNPKTGADARISARRVAVFLPGEKMRDSVRDAENEK